MYDYVFVFHRIPYSYEAIWWKYRYNKHMTTRWLNHIYNFYLYPLFSGEPVPLKSELVFETPHEIGQPFKTSICHQLSLIVFMLTDVTGHFQNAILICVNFFCSTLAIMVLSQRFAIYLMEEKHGHSQIPHNFMLSVKSSNKKENCFITLPLVLLNRLTLANPSSLQCWMHLYCFDKWVKTMCPVHVVDSQSIYPFTGE